VRLRVGTTRVDAERGMTGHGCPLNPVEREESLGGPSMRGRWNCWRPARAGARAITGLVRGRVCGRRRVSLPPN